MCKMEQRKLPPQSRKTQAIRMKGTTGRTSLNRDAYNQQIGSYMTSQTTYVPGQTADDIEAERKAANRTMVFNTDIPAVLPSTGSTTYHSSTEPVEYSPEMYRGSRRAASDSAEKHVDMEDRGEVRLNYSNSHDVYASNPYGQNLLLDE
jgi:hypothetical protein